MEEIKAVDLPSWHALGPELQKLRDHLAKGPIANGNPEFLFRGQSNSEWRLQTTLERAGCERMPFVAYYGRAARVKPAVETFTGVKWDAPDFSIDLEKSFRSDYELFSDHRFPTVEFYRYMVYLRHHGFPSPLLDWTESLNVAAFFAFREAGDVLMRSIYVYCERPNIFKALSVGSEPMMRAIGKYVRSHPRHFRQQSNYTICANFEKDSGWQFHPHGPVFGRRGEQDFVWKFNIPSAERVSVLRELDRYNLNAFSLFDTEETLLETMWFREHVVKIRD
jgi:hypothetical protein